MDGAGPQAEGDRDPGAVEVLVLKAVQQVPVIMVLVRDLRIIHALVLDLARPC